MPQFPHPPHRVCPHGVFFCSETLTNTVRLLLGFQSVALDPQLCPAWLRVIPVGSSLPHPAACPWPRWEIAFMAWSVPEAGSGEEEKGGEGSARCGQGSHVPPGHQGQRVPVPLGSDPSPPLASWATPGKSLGHPSIPGAFISPWSVS